MEGVHVSRFGVIRKLHQLGKWRLITDMSLLKGSSVNDGINPKLCPVSYDAVRRILNQGQGPLMLSLTLPVLIGSCWYTQRIDCCLAWNERVTYMCNALSIRTIQTAHYSGRLIVNNVETWHNSCNTRWFSNSGTTCEHVFSSCSETENPHCRAHPSQRDQRHLVRFGVQIDTDCRIT